MSAAARTFLALVPPAEVCDVLARAARATLGASDELRVYPAQDLHATLAFLGPIGAVALERLAGALGRACSAIGAADVRATGTGAFPARGRERILWAGVEPADVLAQLFRAAVAAARAAGCEPADAERRPWTPHITLARVGERRVCVPEAFYELSFDLSWTVREVVVCQSDPRPAADARYPVVHRVVLPG